MSYCSQRSWFIETVQGAKAECYKVMLPPLHVCNGLSSTADAVYCVPYVYLVSNKKLSCRRERLRDASCLSVVSFNIPTAQFFLVTAASDLLVHKILLNSVLLSPIVFGIVRPLGYNPLVFCRSWVGWGQHPQTWVGWGQEYE